MTLLVLYVVLAIGVSFLCSIMEAVLLSVTPAYLVSIREEGPGIEQRLRRFKKDIDKPLAAILSLNTIAHTVGAAGAGPQAAHHSLVRSPFASIFVES
jgi:CBS domain containing-hemolysin-like protein